MNYVVLYIFASTAIGEYQMTESFNNTIFGFKLEKEYDTVWGSRAIYNSKTHDIEFLSDRNEIRNPENFGPLKKWLSEKGINTMRKLIHKHGLSQDSREVLIYSDDKYIIKATPNGSYGYMYLVAHAV